MSYFVLGVRNLKRCAVRYHGWLEPKSSFFRKPWFPNQASLSVSMASFGTYPQGYQGKRGCISVHGRRRQSFSPWSVPCRFASSTQEVQKSDEGEVTYLRDPNSDREVFLIGTAHVSKLSAMSVKKLIQDVKPDTIFVELDEKRAKRVKSEAAPLNFAEAFTKRLQDQQPLLSAALGGALQALQSTFQRFGLESGLEFRVALLEAERIGAKLVYGDRCGDETMKLLSQAALTTLPKILPNLMGMDGGAMYSKLKSYHTPGGFFQGLDKDSLEKMVEELKNRKQIRENTKILDEIIPDVMQVMLHQRDQIMTDNLKKLPLGSRTVAVVGMAHMDGIEKRYLQGEGFDKNVSTIEPPRFIMSSE